MRRWTLLISLAAVLSILAGCDERPTPYKVDLSKRESISFREDSDAITYAYLPQYSHTVSYQRHNLMVDYLRQETGLNLRQIFPDTFNQHMKMVGQGKIDVSYSNPFIYTKIAHQYHAKAFARVVEGNNRKDFRSQIICRADNQAIQSIADCRGKSWIAVDASSAGGYLYALGYFMAHGLYPHDFKEIAFAPGPGGKQEKVVLSVQAGKYDIGTIREGTLNVVANKIDINDIRVIASTRWYPGWVYAARKELKPAIIQNIKRALLKLDYSLPGHKKILDAASVRAIIPSDDKDFNPVRELAARIGISLDQ